MGVVYEPERVSAGLLPDNADGRSQRDAAIVLGDALQELAISQPSREEALLGYMVYGSATRFGGKPNRRSDVDLLVISREGNDPMIGSVHERIASVGAAFKVDIGNVVFTADQLSGHHRVNPFYSEHLSLLRSTITVPSFIWFASTFEKGIPTNGFTPHEAYQNLFWRAPFAEAWPFGIAYLNARRDQFQTNLEDRDNKLSILKGPFELPRNLGRTLVDLYCSYLYQHTGVYVEGLKFKPEDEDLAAQLTSGRLAEHEKLLRITDRAGALGLFGEDIERLANLDSTYSALLEDTVAGRVSVSDYEGWLKSVRGEALGRAFKIVSMADVLVHRAVEYAMDDPSYDQPEQLIPEMLMYPEGIEDQQEWVDLEYKANQVIPVTFDRDTLIASVAPKYPELTSRYLEDIEERKRQRVLDWEMEQEERKLLDTR